MEGQLASSKESLFPKLRHLLETEQRIVFVGVLISALFAVLNTRVSLLFMAVCTLTIGNLMYLLQATAARLYGGRPIPWNWVFYLPLLAVGAS